MRDREKERNIRLPESYVQQGGPVRPPRPSRARRAARIFFYDTASSEFLSYEFVVIVCCV